MKGSIACLLGAVKVLRNLDIEPACEVECCLCTDEEIGVCPRARRIPA